jgi:hypothetical protein
MRKNVAVETQKSCNVSKVPVVEHKRKLDVSFWLTCDLALSQNHGGNKSAYSCNPTKVSSKSLFFLNICLHATQEEK